MFNLPGTGTLLVGAVAGRDYPLVQGIVLFSGVFVVLVGTVADIITVRDRSQGRSVRVVGWFRSLPSTGQAGVDHHPADPARRTAHPAAQPVRRVQGRRPGLNRAPSLAHPFGIDNLGRDIFTRSFAATHLDIVVAVVGVLIPLLVGTIVGALAATTDVRAIRGTIGLLIDGINAFPFLILALGVIAVVGTGALSVIIAIAVTSWARYAKLARTRAAVLRDLDFVSALKLLGYGRTRITVRHILPNCFSETAAYGVSDFTLVILTVAALSFLGRRRQAAARGMGLDDGRWADLPPVGAVAARRPGHRPDHHRLRRVADRRGPQGSHPWLTVADLEAAPILEGDEPLPEIVVEPGVPYLDVDHLRIGLMRDGAPLRIVDSADVRAAAGSVARDRRRVGLGQDDAVPQLHRDPDALRRAT